MPPSDPAAKEVALHAWSAFGVALVCGLLILGGWKGASAFGGDDDDKPNLDDMEAIEASLAYKKAEPKKQPQKKKNAPAPEVKPEGVSRDEEKKPIEDKKDEPKTKPDDVVDPLADFRRKNEDEDLDTGKTKDEEVGQFDGSEFGFADVTKGDEYWQHLIADMRWEYPELLAGEGVPVGCIHLELDGKVSEIKLHTKSGNDELDDSVERALKTLKKSRDDEPVPVPDRLAKQTRKWICFKFTIQ